MARPPARPCRVLVICTGNACRSILAEALLNARTGGRYAAVSAGSRPTGRVHPETLATLRRHGIDPGPVRSKSWDEFAGQRFDYVISVCDAAAAEPCPVYPGGAHRLHWSTPDPALAAGTAAEVEAAFDGVFAMLERRVEQELR